MWSKEKCKCGAIEMAECACYCPSSDSSDCSYADKLLGAIADELLDTLVGRGDRMVVMQKQAGGTERDCGGRNRESMKSAIRGVLNRESPGLLASHQLTQAAIATTKITAEDLGFTINAKS